MVTAQTQYSLGNARSYFAEHLAVGDYYAEGQTVAGLWFGRGCERLALAGRVGESEFLRLCDNQHPSTAEPLTARLNTVRASDSSTTANRRIFFDFTFSPPKSVSIAALVGGDDRIVAAHAQAVHSALSEFESFAATRIRVHGADTNRSTGNLVSALFTHETSRALDPHLHTHTIVFNATWDPVENRWKALQNQDLLGAKKFAENAYYHELAKALRGFGYQLRNRLQGDFEIEGIAPDLCTRFSKRHAQIDQALTQLLTDKPELAGANLKDLRSRLATAERARKQKELGRAELQDLWESQTTTTERQAFRQLTRSGPGNATVSMEDAVAWAEEHLFDRESVVPEHRIWQEALARSRGGDFTLAELKSFTGASRGYLRHPDSPGTVTLPEVLHREQHIIRLARDGIGAFHPLVRTGAPLDPRLDTDQREALGQLLGSTHAITVFRGGAGTGKSFVLRQLVDQVMASGRPVMVLAPQRQQVVEMQQAGFPEPATVAQFLLQKELPQGAAVIVDEAGQIGGRQMLDLLRLAQERDARVILSGDTRQHGPVEASDALVAIERHAGVKPVELRRIRRQDPNLGKNQKEARAITQYRSAVEAAAKGDLRKSFEQLDAMGAVVPCSPGDQADRLAAEYLALTSSGAPAVVVSQTWSEVHRVNERIRDALKSRGLLGTGDTMVQALDRLDLTTAQKRDQRFYPPEAVVVFNRKVRQAEAGKTGKLAAVLPDAVLVETEGRLVRVANRMLDHITVSLPRDIPLSSGDRLCLKANRTLPCGAKVTNGELATVKSVKTGGEIELTDGRILNRGYREFLPGYAVTSYGSQGKTVDYVLISDSGSRPATNAQQWYVSISRGRKGIRIFTTDKEQLRENILATGHRPLAVDLAGPVAPPRNVPLRWRRLHSQLVRFGQLAVARLGMIRFLRPKPRTPGIRHEQQRTRKLGV